MFRSSSSDPPRWLAVTALYCTLLAACGPASSVTPPGTFDSTLLPLGDASVTGHITPNAGAQEPPAHAGAQATSPRVVQPLPVARPGARDAAIADDSGTVAPTHITCTGEPYPAYVSDPRLCVSVFAADLGTPRQMAFASNGDLFVNHGALTVLWDADLDGQSGPGERRTFASADNLHHGVAFDREQRFVYASSESTVYRWPYSPGAREAQQDAEVVVRDMPQGGHATRTIVLDSQGRLYVSVGSAGNVDQAADQLRRRSQIRRFDATAVPTGGFAYDSGAVFASGLRNEVGLFVDAEDRLWGVENERDGLYHDGLGGDIHNDNPAEEINLFDGQGTTFYGYPQCFTEFKLAGGSGAGTQWADPSIDASIRRTNAWCRDPGNVRAPVFAMQAHYAPLGIVQYTGSALPFTSDFIVASHGSWNRSPGVGRVLLRARYENGQIISAEPIVGERDGNGSLRQGQWDARPVDVQQGPEEALYFSDDLGGRVFKIGYRTE